MKKIKLNEMTNTNDDNTKIDFDLDNDNPPHNDLIALKAVDELLNLDKLKTITRVNPNQVAVITKLYLFSSVFKAPFTSQLADIMLQLQISLRGLGRQELVQLVNQRVNSENPSQGFIKTSKDIFK